MAEHTIPSKHELLSRMAAHLAADSRYMSNVILSYERQEKLSQDELLEHLGASEAQLIQLALCKRPERESENFAKQVQQLASYSGIPAHMIARIVRQVDSIEALLQQPVSENLFKETQQTGQRSIALAATRDTNDNAESSDRDKLDEGDSEEEFK